MSERELSAKQKWRELAGEFRRVEEELDEQTEFKRQLLTQVETLFYNEQYGTQATSDEEVARRAFLCQQDVNALTTRIGKVGETIKRIRAEKEAVERRQEEARRREGGGRVGRRMGRDPRGEERVHGGAHGGGEAADGADGGCGCGE